MQNDNVKFKNQITNNNPTLWKIAKVILIFIIFYNFMLVNVSFSATLSCETDPSAYPWCEAGKEGIGGSTGLVARFYQIALALVGVTAFAVIVFAGVLYIVNASNPSKQKEAMDWIWAAVFGIVLLLGAYLLFYTINPELVKLKEPVITEVKIPPPTPSANQPANSLSTNQPTNPVAANMIPIQPPTASQITACLNDKSTFEDYQKKKVSCDGEKKNNYEWIMGTCNYIATIANTQDYCKQKGKSDVGGSFAKNFGVCCKP